MKKLLKIPKTLWGKIGLAVICLGIGAAVAYVRSQMVGVALNGVKIANESSNGAEKEETNTTPTPTFPISLIEEETSPSGNVAQHASSTSDKFTIEEVGKLTADRVWVETGQQVNFSATLKNTGTKKKLLTHVCLNHSGAVTSGCILNHNLEPGSVLSFTGSMVFREAGSYLTQLTWSQDGVNFYQTKNGNAVTVRVE